MTRRKLELNFPRRDESGRRGSFIAAIVLNILTIVLISSVVAVPTIFMTRAHMGDKPIAEHVTFIDTKPPKPPRVDTAVTRRAVPPPEPAPAVAPPGAGAPPVTPPVTPPAQVPVTIAPPAAAGDTGKGGGAAPRGLLPGAIDPRLLGIGLPQPRPTSVVPNRPSPDSAVRSWVRAYWDSVADAQAGVKRNPQDWTTERNGKKYGIDPQYVYFGSFKLPTALLALLPINVQSNPGISERNRALDEMRSDILYQAMRAKTAADFNAAVKELRARKDAEHAAKQADKKPPPP